MTSKLRSTKTPGFEDSLGQDFPTFLDKKPQNQPKSKANPQHKILNDQKYTESLRDHGDSYQTGRLNSNMPIERLGSRDINPGLSADGCFSAEDLMRRFGKGKNPQQEVQKNERQEDASIYIARERLKQFSLESLTMTKTGKFDGRLKETKEYLNLCTSADVDPYEYYEENLHKQPVYHPAQNHHEDEKEEEHVNHVRNGGNQHARAELDNFPLSSLKITKDNEFDKRFGSYKKFKALCEAANEDPMQYYYHLCEKQGHSSEPEESLVESQHNYQPASYDKSEKIKNPVYQNHQYEKEESESEKQAALRKLEEFPFHELWLTKKNTLDMRKNNTKDYLYLCSAAEVNPMDYYFDHVGNASNMNITNGESQISKKSTESQKSVSSGNNSVTLTKDNKLDKRFSSTRDFIREKMAESESKLSQFDTSQLKYKANGELDKRYKVNKEYIELQEQTQESYWQNVKFNE